MRKSRREQYKSLTRVTEAELQQFDLLDRATQLQVIQFTVRAAQNPRVPTLDREIAKKRAEQFRRRLKIESNES